MMTTAEFRAFVKELGVETRHAISARVEPIAARLAAVEARIAHLEAATTKPKLRHRGAWQASATYMQGDSVVHEGKLFRCTVNHVTEARPGAGAGVVWTKV